MTKKTTARLSSLMNTLHARNKHDNKAYDTHRGEITMDEHKHIKNKK